MICTYSLIMTYFYVKLSSGPNISEAIPDSAPITVFQNFLYTSHDAAEQLQMSACRFIFNDLKITWFVFNTFHTFYSRTLAHPDFE